MNAYTLALLPLVAAAVYYAAPMFNVDLTYWQALVGVGLGKLCAVYLGIGGTQDVEISLLTTNKNPKDGD